MKKPPVAARAIERGLAPFRGQRAAHLLPRARLGGPMPWVIAIMVTLTVVAGGGGLALGNLAERARGDLAGSATVQIIEADAEDRAAQAERVVTLLSNNPMVANVRPIPPEEVQALIEPWLGGDGVSEAVPIPALIDLSLREEAGPEGIDKLQERLSEVAPDARIDAQSDWLAPVLAALSSLKWMAFALIALLSFTGAAAVWLAARNALGINRDTIEIVHLLGGSDDQIARIFQRSILMDAALGGGLGLLLGTSGIWLLGAQFAVLDSGLVAGGGLAAIDWLVLAIVPLAAVGIAVYTARMTVLSSLRRML